MDCRCLSCDGLIGTFEPDEESPLWFPQRCEACNSHISKSVLHCGLCGIEVGTIEIDDRNPPTSEAIAGTRCGACSRNEEDGA